MKKTTIQGIFGFVAVLGFVLIFIFVKPMLARIISYFVWWLIVQIVGCCILDD